jgi:transcriptional regulator with XRE-family HTH domain
MPPKRQSTSLQGSENAPILTAQQCKMARAGLGLGVRDLAGAAKVSTNTITRLERGEGIYPRTLAAIRAALESAGVAFIEENGGGPGVRLRKD